MNIEQGILNAQSITMDFFIKVILISFFFSFLSCSEKQSFEGEFKGFWGETEWIYTFQGNGEYSLITRGHVGGVEEKGQFFRNDEFLFLVPNNELPEMLINRFSIINKSHIRDLKGNHYWSSAQLLEKEQELSFDKRMKAFESIKNLETVKAEQEKRTETKMSVNYKGIARIDKVEYEYFALESRNIEYSRTVTHRRFVLENPFKIYELHHPDSLVLVYPK